MNDLSFSIEISVAATPESVVSSIQNVAGWWATNVQGRLVNPGDTMTVRFGKTFSTLRATQPVHDRELVWSVVDCDLPLFENPKDWLHTSLVWEISVRENRTWLKFTHRGLTPAASCYKDCQKGWTFYVKESLQSLIDNGRGFPGTGIFSYILAGDRRYEGLLYFNSDPLPAHPAGCLFVDVKATHGEQVTAAYSVGVYDNAFTTASLKGEYFMVVESPISPGIASDIMNSLS